MKFANFISCLVAIIGTMVACQSRAESWNYQAYSNGRPTMLGYITLEEKSGQGYLTFYTGPMNECYRGELKTLVERTESAIIITPTPARSPPTCDEIRFIIKVDGSGGTREEKSGGKWVADGINRILTIRK